MRGLREVVTRKCGRRLLFGYRCARRVHHAGDCEMSMADREKLRDLVQLMNGDDTVIKKYAPTGLW